jgi:hypothetical protein
MWRWSWLCYFGLHAWRDIPGGLATIGDMRRCGRCLRWEDR